MSIISKASLLKRALLDILKQYPFSVENNDNEYVFNLLATEFKTLIKKKTTAGLALQKVVKHVFNTKPSNALILDLFPLVKQAVGYLYGNIKTKQKIFGDLRQILKQKYGEHSAVYKASKKDLAIDYEEFEQVSRQTTERRDGANANRKQFEKQKLFHLMQQLKASSSFEDEVILVALATGARFIEILRESQFLPVAGDPNKVKISGVAKKKNTEEKYEFIKPLIFLRNNEVRAVVNDLRKLSLDGDGEDVTNAQLSGRFNTRVNKRIRQLGLQGTIHDLRKIYGALSYELHPDKNKISLNEWLKQVLGHAKTETSLHYTNVNLRDDPIVASELQSEIKQLEQRVKKIEEPDSYPQNADPNMVRFVNKNGKVAYIKKLAKRRINDWNQRKEYIQALVNEMREKGVAVTNLNLRKLGVGAESANRFIKDNKI